MTLRRLWLIGCGNMAGAMLRRWIASGAVRGEDVFVLNRREQALLAEVRQGRALPDGELPDAVLLGVKPQQLNEVAGQVAARIVGAPLLISILAGVDAAALAARFDVKAIVRAMPNLPVEIGKGVVVLASEDADGPARQALTALMTSLGLVEWTDAACYGAASMLSGCGPAYVYRVIDALAAAGERLGLPADQALRLALATLEGGASLAVQSPDMPAILAERVASPGGTTRAGLDVLDDQAALKSLLTRTLAASVARAEEMAAAARG